MNHLVIALSTVLQEKQRFLTDVLHEVMLLDGLASSHPVSQEVLQATDIDRVFDWIAYKKVRIGNTQVLIGYFTNLRKPNYFMLHVLYSSLLPGS